MSVACTKFTPPTSRWTTSPEVRSVDQRGSRPAPRRVGRGTRRRRVRIPLTSATAGGRSRKSDHSSRGSPSARRVASSFVLDLTIGNQTGRGKRRDTAVSGSRSSNRQPGLADAVGPPRGWRPGTALIGHTAAANGRPCVQPRASREVRAHVRSRTALQSPCNEPPPGTGREGVQGVVVDLVRVVR
jgi:hypothetical protein